MGAPPVQQTERAQFLIVGPTAARRCRRRWPSGPPSTEAMVPRRWSVRIFGRWLRAWRHCRRSSARPSSPTLSWTPSLCASSQAAQNGAAAWRCCRARLCSGARSWPARKAAAERAAPGLGLGARTPGRSGPRDSATITGHGRRAAASGAHVARPRGSASTRPSAAASASRCLGPSASPSLRVPGSRALRGLGSTAGPSRAAPPSRTGSGSCSARTTPSPGSGPWGGRSTRWTLTPRASPRRPLIPSPWAGEPSLTPQLVLVGQ
mmetsp:Transcript_52843/g.150667  ORF Transcript_52843/g.150667 Transcript_52843/m.150667 type:complete len:264 (-) Transcript_52843:142-933(-)